MWIKEGNEKADSMSNTFIFFRHALTKIDLSKPADKWTLSKEGMEKAKEILTSKEFNDVDIIYTSTEKKAIQTAYYLSKKQDKEIIADSRLNELNRGHEFIDTKYEYENTVAKVFSQMNSRVGKWEAANSALTRFQKAIEEIDRKYNDKKILVVSHGIVLTLYFVKLLELPSNELFKRWKSLLFCDWGTVKEGRVIKDIINK